MQEFTLNISFTKIPWNQTYHLNWQILVLDQRKSSWRTWQPQLGIESHNSSMVKFYLAPSPNPSSKVFGKSLHQKWPQKTKIRKGRQRSLLPDVIGSNKVPKLGNMTQFWPQMPQCELTQHCRNKNWCCKSKEPSKKFEKTHAHLPITLLYRPVQGVPFTNFLK